MLASKAGCYLFWEGVNALPQAPPAATQPPTQISWCVSSSSGSLLTFSLPFPSISEGSVTPIDPAKSPWVPPASTRGWAAHHHSLWGGSCEEGSQASTHIHLRCYNVWVSSESLSILLEIVETAGIMCEMGGFRAALWRPGKPEAKGSSIGVNPACNGAARISLQLGWTLC